MMGKRENHVPEDWMAWLRAEKCGMTPTLPFLQTNEGEARPFLHVRRGRKRGARNRDDTSLCQVAIFERRES